MKTKQVWILASVALGAMALLAWTKSSVKAPPPDIDPAHFVREVDNEFFPLRPGTTFIYEGTDGEVPTRDEMTVTHETKTILGVNCTVVRDLAFEDGVLV